ncbi:alpha/beta fold hydrolase [Thermodesulfobacteriota bacterium]
MEKPLLYYEVHGDKGPYLLLVHGILSSRAQWLPNLEALKSFCRPVVIELFGHGRSPVPENHECYTPDNYVLEFERIRLNLGAEKWFVCGQSLGASLTMLYTVRHPESIIAQIFTNSRSALSGPMPSGTAKLITKRIKEEGRKVIDNLPLHPAKSRYLPAKIKEALIDDITLMTLEGFINTTIHTVGNSHVRELLPETKVPTLLIAGRFDKQFEPLIKVAEELIPDLEFLVLDAGHAVNIGESDRFNKAVKEFITRFTDI